MWNFLKTRGVDLAITAIALTALMPEPAWATPRCLGQPLVAFLPARRSSAPSSSPSCGAGSRRAKLGPDRRGASLARRERFRLVKEN